ncbi:MAG: hypothetical protein QOI74_1979 [Micromonosporaceae bacterium]|nr:hypothetical protein [Micromonosporaceae bacterium]
MRLAGVVVAAIGGCALIGCGAAAPQRAGAAPATSASAAASPADPPASPADPPASPADPPASPADAVGSPVSPVGYLLVSYRRQGGIAGFDDRLTVRTSGSYQVSRRGGTPTEGRLSADELAGLRRALDAARFTGLAAVNSGPAVADGFTYVVGYAGHQVVAADGGVPAALAPVLTRLNDILSR